MYKIGHSKDVHQLIENRKLILGGIEIPHNKGLLGHSDADVLLHAIIESLIGAMGLGDIGTLFPDTDNKYKNISSLILLEQTNELLVKNNYKINNIDATIFVEKPKMKPHISKMKEKIAKTLNVELEQINIKATRGEGMGFVGREEGIGAESVCLIIKD